MVKTAQHLFEKVVRLTVFYNKQTPQSRILLEKLIVTQLGKKFHTLGT